MPTNTIPIETILRMVLDKSSADDVKRFMDQHESSWSTIDKYVQRIGDNVESIAKMGMGAIGLGGLGALANNFMQTSQAGSNLALASGHVTGGWSTWHGYGQAMLSAQAKTGVSAQEISQGLIQAVHAVGGNPTPDQAAMLGGLLAGFGQVVGMSPSQVSQVVAPLLQASNKRLTAGNLMSTMATMESGLSSAPGSQAAAVMAMVSQQAFSTALGSGPMGSYNPELHSTTALVNAARQTNSIWKNTGTLHSAISSVGGGLQNAYGNPSQEAFMQMGGIGYDQQRRGFTASNVEKIMSEATRLYGTGDTRDIFLRSMFGLSGADLLETFSPGSRGAHNLTHDLHHHDSTRRLRHQIANAQQRTTPHALGERAGGSIAHWLEQNFGTAALGAGGLLFGPKLLRSLPKLARRFRGRGAGDGGDDGIKLGELEDGTGFSERMLGDEAGNSLLRGLLDFGTSATGVATAGLGTAALSLAFPDSISVPGAGGAGVRQAVTQDIREAQRRYGRHFGDAASRRWMWNQFGYRSPEQVGKGGPGTQVPATHLWYMATGQGESPHNATLAQNMLKQVFKQLAAERSGQSPTTVNGQDPISVFSQAATKLLQFANKLTTTPQGPHGQGSSYQYGSALGTGGVQSLESTPSVEFAALQLGGSGGGGGGATTSLASLTLSGGGSGGGRTGGSVSGGGWQTAVASWYDPGAGGMNGHWGGGAWSGHPVEPGTYGFAKQEAMPMAYGTRVQFRYKGKVITATCVDCGPLEPGRSFDLLPGPARDLGMTAAGVVTLQYRVVSAGSGSSGQKHSGGGSSGGGGAIPAVTAGGGGMTAATSSQSGGSGGIVGNSVGGSNQTVINVFADHQLVRKHRILRGHRS